jgi:hypothetical protein
MLPPRSQKEKAYTHQQETVNIMMRSKPRQTSALDEALLVRRQGSVGASGRPHPVRWWLLTTMAGALTPRALAMVIIPRHHKLGGRVSFEIRSDEGHCRSDSMKIEMVG